VVLEVHAAEEEEQEEGGPPPSRRRVLVFERVQSEPDARRRIRDVVAAEVLLLADLSVAAFVFSLVLTRGVERVAQELAGMTALAGGVKPEPAPALIFGGGDGSGGMPGFCEDAVMSLAMWGRATNAMSEPAWADRLTSPPPRVGFLVGGGPEAVAPYLRHPEQPVWCALWGGHVKVCLRLDDADTGLAGFYFTDGLHLDQAVSALSVLPAGLCELESSGSRSSSSATISSVTRAADWRRTLPAGGSGRLQPLHSARYLKVAEIVQEVAVDGGGGRLLLVVCETDGDVPADCACRACRNETRWYCRDCYLSVPRVYSYNDAGASCCKGCGEAKSAAGSGHWLEPDMVPRPDLLVWDRDRAPKELQLVRLRWPNAEMSGRVKHFRSEAGSEPESVNE
jgi:hypothetical protein